MTTLNRWKYIYLILYIIIIIYLKPYNYVQANDDY